MQMVAIDMILPTANRQHSLESESQQPDPRQYAPALDVRLLHSYYLFLFIGNVNVVALELQSN